MIRRILCPVDLEEASINALNYAGSLAKAMKAELVLLNVIPEERPPVVEESGVMDELRMKEEEIEAKLQEACQEAREYFGINCNYKVSSSVLRIEVEREVNQGKYDLLVMGTGGVLTLQEYYFGSNAAQVMDVCDCPMITVPKDYHQTEINHIVYASNYKSADEVCLEQVLELARLNDAEITVLHVSHEKEPFGEEVFEAITNQIRKRFEFEHQAELKFDRVVFDDVEMGLRNYLYDHEVDLVAVLTEHRNFLKRMFHDSMSKELVLLAEYPILTFHK
jgi:nucleotide-binding universal stress UspA family protein